jgi:hypothetical protein
MEGIRELITNPAGRFRTTDSECTRVAGGPGPGRCRRAQLGVSGGPTDSEGQCQPSAGGARAASLGDCQ